jgi:hypothetical protein
VTLFVLSVTSAPADICPVDSELWWEGVGRRSLARVLVRNPHGRFKTAAQVQSDFDWLLDALWRQVQRTPTAPALSEAVLDAMAFTRSDLSEDEVGEIGLAAALWWDNAGSELALGRVPRR